MNNSFYKKIYNQLQNRSVEATLGVLGIKNPSLREYLTTVLSDKSNDELGILADPVFEAVFPWQEGEKTFAELIDNLLHPKLVKALHNPPDNLKGQALLNHFKPYTHQISTWQLLKEETPKSVVVTSGTGSGKTECFMVPILDDLVRQREHNGRLTGVQALMLYPLNALINSQRERLLAWTAAFNSDIQFCLYNGNLPKKLKQQEKTQKPVNEIHDRFDLRDSPPPILVTNPTMLEYMLIRNTDRPILEKSQGKLKYIVLDEAHTYIGSQAAELALLIRRALFSFGVNAAQVRFIATSATIGTTDEAKEKLKKYLSDLAGIPIEHVEVIGGERLIPTLPSAKLENVQIPEIQALEDGKSKYDKLCISVDARKIRDTLTNSNSKALKLSVLSKTLFPNLSEKEQDQQTLEWLDACSDSKVSNGKDAFLPLRGHFFHRTLNGLWSCVDSKCSKKLNTSLETGWSFGRVYTQQRIQCLCGAPVFEIVFCNDCNSEHLRAELIENTLIQKSDMEQDEFRLENETEENEEHEDEGNNHEGGSVIVSPINGQQTFDQVIDKQGLIIGAGSEGIEINLSFDVNTCQVCSKNGTQTDTFRPAYLGMPFYSGTIIPTLLENTKSDKDNPLSLPAKGRNLITFTDSRQGTAKIAIKMQLDAERARVRGKIFHLVNRQNPEIQSKIAEIEETNLKLKLVPQNPIIDKMIADNKQEIEVHKSQFHISWDMVIKSLSEDKDFSIHIFDYYKSLTPGLFDNVESLAAFLLLREFARRPKRANSLETLGLVSLHYPALDKIQEAPSIFSRYQLGLSDWKDFLKICIDFHIRESTFIKISDTWLSWFGAKIYPKELLSPTSQEEQDVAHKKWPEYRMIGRARQGRLVRILMAGFGFDSDDIDREKIDILNEVLRQAWHELVKARLLIGDREGNFSFDFQQAAFRKVSRAWYCPFTLRVLDTTFSGISPYLPIRPSYESLEIKCEEILMPVFPEFQINSEIEGLDLTRQWHKDNTQVADLRKRGIWTDQSDRISEGGLYFRSAEHSAQQNPKTLQKYERRFKEGRINVLNCSTTMEMGVDIGGLSIVHNNNVPPHPANYLQRAGRAGRRRESQSLSTTLCKSNTHDLSVFRNPDWPFLKQPKEPNISLRSEPIVQRHINALLFGYFLNVHLRDIDQNRILLRSSWFFKNEGQLSFALQMIEWMDRLKDSMPEDLGKGFELVRSKSVLIDFSKTAILNQSIGSLRKIQEGWQQESEFLAFELEKLKNEGIGATDPYFRRVEIDIKRHEREFLFKELIAGGFLPGYGFPVGIATFDPSTVQDFKRAQQDYSDDDEETSGNRFNRLPSRNLAIALSEYSPGSEIVLDGKVFVSEGINLTGQFQGKETENQIQSIKTAWRCKKCGSTGTHGLSNQSICTSCSEPLALTDEENNFRFLQPNGFSTGFYSGKVTNDISNQNFVPAKEPWITANTELRPLPNNRLGYFKSDPNGQILYYNSGQNGKGFAICLSCGRAESIDIHGGAPTLQDTHKRLRGGQGKGDCDGSPQMNLRLGYEEKTDVFELYLKDPNSNQLLLADGENRARNQKICFTISVALRDSLAGLLGVNVEEIGCTVKEVRIQESEGPVFGICLYDTNGGGSGFSSTAQMYLPELFKRTLEALECKANCNCACENCLISYDTRIISRYLDRNIALEFLRSGFMSLVELPDSLKFLGPDSVYCPLDFFSELAYVIQRNSNRLLLFFDGKADDLDLSFGMLKHRFHNQWAGIPEICLIFNRDAITNISPEQKLLLYNGVAGESRIKLYSSNKFPKNGHLLAIAQGVSGSVSFATNDSEANLFNENWGKIKEFTLVKAKDIQIEKGLDLQEISKASLMPRVNLNSLEISINDELNGSIDAFGDKFWEIIESKAKEVTEFLAKQKLESVIYSDRYLLNPFVVYLLTRIINSIPSESIKNAKISIISEVPDYNGFHQNRWFDKNWKDKEVSNRTQFAKTLITSSAEFDFKAMPKADLEHSRILTFNFSENRKIVVRFDQGMGYWSLRRGAPYYPFESSIENQVDWIAANKNKLIVEKKAYHSTHINVSIT